MLSLSNTLPSTLPADLLAESRIRDRALLTTALDVTPPYLRTAQASAGLVTDYRNMSISLGRRFRSLKIWFALRSYGVAGFRAHLRKLNKLAETFEHDLLQRTKGVELFTPRRFSLVVLRVTSTDPSRNDLAYENALNARTFKLSTADHSIMLTTTIVGGEECVRVAIGSPYTEEKHVKELVDKINDLIARAREEVDAERV